MRIKSNFSPKIQFWQNFEFFRQRCSWIFFLGGWNNWIFMPKSRSRNIEKPQFWPICGPKLMCLSFENWNSRFLKNNKLLKRFWWKLWKNEREFPFPSPTKQLQLLCNVFDKKYPLSLHPPRHLITNPGCVKNYETLVDFRSSFRPQWGWISMHFRRLGLFRRMRDPGSILRVCKINWSSWKNIPFLVIF